MLDFPTWRKVWLWLITGLCIAAALPSLLSATSIRWPDALPEPMVNLGLALAGGSHILLEADAAQVATQRLENMEENAELFMAKMGFAHDTEGLELSDDQLVNFLLLCYQGMVLPDEEEEIEEEHMDGDVKVKVMKVDSGDMQSVMDQILGHGSPKIGM